jgi:hypothetical protein
MQFRSPTDEPIRIALLSGHTANVGPEWRSLPEIFHHAAMTHGCERDDSRVVPIQKPVEAGEEAMHQVTDIDAKYRAALITMLSRSQEGDFTTASLPNINTVSSLVGFAATKVDVLRVFREMKDEADKGEAEAKATADGKRSEG